MLNSTLDSQVIKKFFHWWKKELSFLVPKRISQFFNENSGVIIIQIKENKLHFSSINNNKTQNIASLERNEAGLLNYQQLKLDYPNLEKSKIILRLNQNEGVIKELIFPKAIEENLSQVITYELDRYTPFNQQQVYYAVKKIATENDKIKLTLILTPKDKLNTAYETLNKWSIIPWLADYEGMANNLQDDYAYYNLLPEEKRHQQNKKALILQSVLIAGIVLLFASLFILPVWFQYDSGKSLENKIYKIKRKAIKVQELQNKIAELSEKTGWLIAQKNKYPPFIEILETISRLLKDDTSLTMLEYKNEKVHLMGESPAAAALIKILESSPLFSNADFESTVTKNKATGLERFRIIVSVNSREDHAAE